MEKLRIVRTSTSIPRAEILGIVRFTDTVRIRSAAISTSRAMSRPLAKVRRATR
jgi:hypothetical protein